MVALPAGHALEGTRRFGRTLWAERVAAERALHAHQALRSAFRCIDQRENSRLPASRRSARWWRGVGCTCCRRWPRCPAWARAKRLVQIRPFASPFRRDMSHRLASSLSPEKTIRNCKIILANLPRWELYPAAVAA